MSTSSDIRAAWNTAIWNHATVTAMTTKIYAYDITANNEAKKEVSNYYYNQKINFFKYLVIRTPLMFKIAGGSTNVRRFEYQVVISYFLEKDLAETTTTSTNYNTVIDRLETVDGLVVTQLGRTWSSTVHFWNNKIVNPPKIAMLDDKEVWYGEYAYVAEKILQ